MNENIVNQRLEAVNPMPLGPSDQGKPMKPQSLDQDLNETSRPMMRKEDIQPQVKSEVIKQELRLSKELPSS